MGLISSFIGGAGAGTAEVGKMLFVNKLQEERDEANFLRDRELKKEDRTYTTSEREATQDFTLERDDKKIGADKDAARYDKETVSADVLAKFEHDTELEKSGGKISNSRREYLELVEDYKRKHGKEPDAAADNNFKSIAYGAAERIATRDNEVHFVGLQDDGTMGITAQYARPTDEDGNPTGSRRDREFSVVDPAPGIVRSAAGKGDKNEPKKLNAAPPDGTTVRGKDGKLYIVKDGKPVLKTK